MAYQNITHFLDRPIQTGRVYDIFLPENIQHETAIFLIHGGGWTGGSRTNFHTPIMETLAEKGYIVASTDYRLTVSAMEQLKDCREAYMHFVNELRKLNRPVKIAVYGSSAGAHLASLLSVAKPGASGEDFSGEWVDPECVMLQSCPMSFEPWDEIFPHIWTSMQHAARVPSDKDPEVYKKLSLDHHIPAKKIASLKVPAIVKIYKNMEHGFLFNFDREHQREAFADLIKYIENETIEDLDFEA